MRRNAIVDYARLLAAFGIVLFHSGAPGAAVGYAALPFFLMVLVILMVSGLVKCALQSLAAPVVSDF